ncbi:hypothetical protein Poly24_13100 [Rosistilla carotiformis]|uniref:Uncharacterized protein n=1 Tax=Rosistilla carotiformis TaxID=2528017 RepID=A0A518JPY5_9BACT|nr:hypothetical protein Poly24_13100 [Rosistilla carotiformis]
MDDSQVVCRDPPAAGACLNSDAWQVAGVCELLGLKSLVRKTIGRELTQVPRHFCFLWGNRTPANLAGEGLRQITPRNRSIKRFRFPDLLQQSDRLNFRSQRRCRRCKTTCQSVAQSLHSYPTANRGELRCGGQDRGSVRYRSGADGVPLRSACCVDRVHRVRYRFLKPRWLVRLPVLSAPSYDGSACGQSNGSVAPPFEWGCALAAGSAAERLA